MIQELADKVAELRDRKGHFKAQLDATNAELEAAEKELVDRYGGRRYAQIYPKRPDVLPVNEAICQHSSG